MLTDDPDAQQPIRYGFDRASSVRLHEPDREWKTRLRSTRRCRIHGSRAARADHSWRDGARHRMWLFGPVLRRAQCGRLSRRHLVRRTLSPEQPQTLFGGLTEDDASPIAEHLEHGTYYDAKRVDAPGD